MVLNNININNEIIADLIEEHQTRLLPRYNNLQEIYEGKHDITKREATGGKPNNKLVVDFQGYITRIMSGYFMGKPVLYNSINSDTDEDEELLEKIQDLFRINNEQKQNNEIARDLSIKGEAFEVLYINDDKEIGFVQIPAEEMILKYENSFKKRLDLALRYYTIEDVTNGKDIKKVEVYTKDKIQFFTEVSKNKFTLDNEIEHHFKEVPVIHYLNNKEKSGDWENVISLINELELRLSDNANELQAFRESYLILKGLGIDGDQLKEFREAGAMSFDEDGDASFLTKNINDQFAENHINRLVDLIHKMAMIPDMSDDKFGGNLSGISIKFKLYSIETITSIKESYFKEALIRRLKLITNYINYIELKDYNYNDLEIIFTRNIPANITEIVENSIKLAGIISKETVISQLPFITNVNEEIARIEEEKNAYADYFKDYDLDDDLEGDED